MRNPERIRSTGTAALVFILAAAIAAPVTMLMAFPWVTRDKIAQVMNVAVEAVQPAEAEAAKPMVFEPTVITLEEADATVAAADAVSRHRCSSATDEAGAPIAEPILRFVPLCDEQVGQIGDLAVAATYDAKRGLMPYDVVEAVPPVVATYR